MCIDIGLNPTITITPIAATLQLQLRKMSNGRHDETSALCFLADFPLPGFIPFVSAMPANEHMLASTPLYELNCSHKVRRLTIFRYRQ
jgi:hypothetical protein